MQRKYEDSKKIDLYQSEKIFYKNPSCKVSCGCQCMTAQLTKERNEIKFKAEVLSGLCIKALGLALAVIYDESFPALWPGGYELY